MSPTAPVLKRFAINGSNIVCDVFKFAVVYKKVYNRLLLTNVITCYIKALAAEILKVMSL
jgi:hypothetical protein